MAHGRASIGGGGDRSASRWSSRWSLRAETNMTGPVLGAVTIAPTVPSGPSRAHPCMRDAGSASSAIRVMRLTRFSGRLRAVATGTEVVVRHWPVGGPTGDRKFADFAQALDCPVHSLLLESGSWTMRATRRRRPRKRRICVPPGTDLDVLADRVTYVGSPEHKDFPTFAGQPRLRGDASRCPREITDREMVRGWLCSSIRRGATGAP